MKLSPQNHLIIRWVKSQALGARYYSDMAAAVQYLAGDAKDCHLFILEKQTTSCCPQLGDGLPPQAIPRDKSDGHVSRRESY